MHVKDCDCAPILRFFSAASDGATAGRKIQNRNCWSILYQFEEVYVANYAWIWTLFSVSVIGCTLQRTKRFVVPSVASVGGATRFANLRRKFSKTQKIGSRVVPNTSYIVTIYIVINCTHVLYSSICAWQYPARTALPSRWCFCF